MMKTLTYTCMLVLTLISCKVQKVEKVPINGTFYKLEKGTDFKISYTLELRVDSTFKLLFNAPGGKPHCEGKWELKDNEIIILECFKDGDPYETITNTYMSQKTHEVKVLSKNRLKYNDVILRRKK